ncbi:hypothetical protein H0O03_03200 [Candidatus Micrarchaeota archaeon]|nr:hypothetical protein [Candidatus Micrarchaeota archaeon]
MSFAGAGTANLAVPIQVKGTAKNGDKLTIYYRGYSFLQTSSGTKVYSRVPTDKTLGFNENTSGHASCYAETNSTAYEIIVPTEEEVTVEPKIPLPKAEFTVSDTIVLDEAGTLRSAYGLEEYVLQIDPVFPADAMPTKLKSKLAGCNILVSPITGNLSTSKCFRFDSTSAAIIFESKETNPLCPVEVRGNKLYEGTQEFKEQQGAAITYRVGGCDISAELTIPIKVTAQDAESVFSAPDTNELGDGDAAKPLYIVNEKQLGARDVKMDYAPLESNETNRTLAENENTITLYGGSAHAIAFRGPGTLTLTDGSETINEVYYQDAIKVMKEGVGTTGYRKTSCTDYKCCAHGWCTRKALKGALKDFQEKASQIAAKTAFRRGGDLPFSIISQNKQFNFATVAQVIQDVDSLLPENNFTIEKTDYEQGSCLNGTPAAFELKASGTSAENLSYSAKILPLYKFAYTDAHCEEGFTQQSEGPYIGLEYQPLCNFLYGNGNCVASAAESNPLTMDQTSHLNLKVTICMFPSFEVVSLPLCVLGCGIGWAIYSACHAACAAESAKCLAYAPVCYTDCINTEQKCETDKKPDDDGSQWKYHKYLSVTLVPKIPAFNINQDIEFNESTTQDAFEKIGHAFSNIDFKNIDYADGMSTCFAINTNMEWQVQNLINNVGGGQGFDYTNWINSLLPIMAAHGCSCSASNMWKGLPAYSPPDNENPKCYGVGDALTAIAGTGQARGVPWSFSFGTSGNNVFLRFDLGAKGNCKISHPFEATGWGQNTQEILRRVVLPLGTSLATYLMTDQKDFSITLSGSPQMGTEGKPANSSQSQTAAVESDPEISQAAQELEDCWQNPDCEQRSDMIIQETNEIEQACTSVGGNAEACHQQAAGAVEYCIGDTAAEFGACTARLNTAIQPTPTPAPASAATTSCESDSQCLPTQKCAAGTCIRRSTSEIPP